MANTISLQQAIDMAKSDPNSQFATQLRKQIEAGTLDDAAKKQGVDLAPYGRTSFKADLIDDFLGIGEGLVDTFQETGEEIVDIAQGDEGVAQKATRIGGEAFRGIGRTVGEAFIGAGKMILPQSTEDKIKGVAQDFGEEVVRYSQDFYTELKNSPSVRDQEIAGMIDSTIEKYKTDENFRNQVNAAGGFAEGLGELVGARVAVGAGKEAVKGTSNLFGTAVRSLPEDLNVPYFKSTEEVVTEAIENTKKASFTRTPSDAVVDAALTGAQKTVELYRNLVDSSQRRIVANLDRQALKETATAPLPDVERRIGEMYVTAVSPGVKGKKTTTEALVANQRQAVESIKNITESKDNIKFRDIETNELVTGQLPSNLWEFGGAITARKSQVYQNILKQIEGAGEVNVDTSRIVKEMTDIIENPVYANETAIINRAQQALDKYLTTDYTPAQLEELIKLENDRLQAFYRGSGTQADAIVSAIVANNLRDMLDEAVEAATGEGIKDLKRQYGNLKAIERDVVHRAIHNAQAREAGLVDMFGIRTISDVSAGMAGNLGALQRGAGQIVGEGFIKALNDRDAMINRMFLVADQAYTGSQNITRTQ